MSDSDQNSSDILDHSGTENEIEHIDSAEQVDLDSEEQTANGSSNMSTQDMINQKILAQLTSIGERLNKLEQPRCKKTSGGLKVKKSNQGTEKIKS